MKSINFARIIVISALLFLIAGIGQMVTTTLHKVPLKIEATEEQRQLLKGTQFEFGEYHQNILAHNISDMVIGDGQVHNKMLFGVTAERDFQEEQLIQRFPIWNRPNLNRYRNFVKLEGDTLYYRDEWKRLSEMGLDHQVHFSYALVSETENQFKEYSVTVPFQLPLSWGEQPFFQRKGDKLAVMFPVRISMERDSYHVFATFVISLKEGKVLESKVVRASLEEGKLIENEVDDTLHPSQQTYFINTVREDFSYNPEIALVEFRDGKLDTERKVSSGQYYQLDYFSMTLQQINLDEKNQEGYLTNYISGKNIYAVSDIKDLHGAPPYSQVSSSAYVPLDKRQSTKLQLYHLNAPSSVKLMAELEQDPYAVRPVLNKNQLAYIQLKNQKNAIAIYDLEQQKEVTTVPIQYEEGAQVYYQNSRTRY